MAKTLFLFFAVAIALFSSPPNFNSFEADFVQTVTNEQKKTIRYSGIVAAKKPLKAYWRYDKPVVKEIFVNEQQTTVYEPNLMQATLMKTDPTFSIDEILKNAKSVEGGKYFTKVGATEIVFWASNGVLERLRYKDKLENEVEIKFLNQKTNRGINDSVFNFTAPKGVDIITH